MTTSPVDPRFALDTANASDMVQKKLSIDAMRKRVGGGVDEEKKLREACEGFESVFLQKMWEQMRKNVKKEGYLHSKDEESYQSMFDTELSKKMASAGGIGLADMLYEQLSQKLAHTSKTTGTASLRTPLPIEPARAPNLRPEVKPQDVPAPEELYSEMDGEAPAAPEHDLLKDALADLADSRDPALDPANATYPMFDLRTGVPLNALAERQKEESEPKREYAVTPLPERVNAPGKARPSNALNGVGRSARHARKKAAQSREMGTEQAEAAPTRSLRRNENNHNNGQDGLVAAPAENAAAPAPAPHSPVTPGTEGMGADWATSGDMVSSYQNQARTLQYSERKPWSRTA